MTTSLPVIYVPGAGGGAPDMEVFRVQGRTFRFHTMSYPGWRRYSTPGFSAQNLIEDMAAQVESLVPEGPIRLVGMSLGGHVAYALALLLQARGREIGGMCAIDSFMIESDGPAPGWQRRALSDALYVLRKGRLREFARLARSKFWRAVIRLSAHRQQTLLDRAASSGLPSAAALDPIFEEELSMRMLIRLTVPWIASLDERPTPLEAPVGLLRLALTSGDDSAWRRRCPQISVHEITGGHHTLLESENIGVFRRSFESATVDWGK